MEFRANGLGAEHAVEPGGRGYVIRKPDGELYNGVWRARRHAVLACRALNETGRVPLAFRPEWLLGVGGKKVPG